MDIPPPGPSVSRRLLLVVAGVVAYLLLAVASILFWGQTQAGFILGHYSVIAVPLAAALAFILVTLLPAGYGSIEIEAFGIKLKGASAPIVLWVVCFLVIVAALKLLS